MLKLVRPSITYKKQYIEMMEEWKASGELIIPYSIKVADYTNFEKMLNYFEEEEKGINLRPNRVSSTTLWAYDEERNIIVGAVNIRHTLNDFLLQNVGHIGDGVRPSERRKGYATQMIKLALEECKKFGIFRVLVICNKDNLASAKSIQKNGGILENEILGENKKIIQRYWIDNK